jgi:hypothetical protein
VIVFNPTRGVWLRPSWARASAAFEGFLSKPFDLEVLVNTVDGGVQNPVRSALSSSTWRAQILDR